MNGSSVPQFFWVENETNVREKSYARQNSPTFLLFDHHIKLSDRFLRHKTNSQEGYVKHVSCTEFRQLSDGPIHFCPGFLKLCEKRQQS